MIGAKLTTVLSKYHSRLGQPRYAFLPSVHGMGGAGAAGGQLAISASLGQDSEPSMPVSDTSMRNACVASLKESMTEDEPPVRADGDHS